MKTKPRIEAHTLTEFTRDIDRLEAIGVPRSKVPNIAAFDKIAVRHATIERESSEYLPGLTAKRDQITRDYANGKATLDDVRTATTAIADLDPVQLRYQVSAAQRELSGKARDLLAGHEAEWINALWPAIDAHYDTIRALGRTAVEGVKRWSQATHGTRVKLGEHYNLSLSHTPNPVESDLDIRAAWSAITTVYTTAARLRHWSILPGFEIELPNAVWQWRAKESEFDNLPLDSITTQPTLETAIILLERGIAPSLNTLADVETLNQLNPESETQS